MSTDTLPEGERFAFWHERIRAWDQFSRLEFIPPRGTSFHGSLEYADFQGIRLCKLKIGSLSVNRPQPQAWEHYRHALNVVFQVRGHSQFEQCGRTVVLSPGEWAISDTRFSSRMVFAADGVEQLLLMVPAGHLHGIQIRDNFTARSFSSRKGLGKLIYQFLSTTFSQLRNLSEQAERTVAETIHQLLSFSLLELLGDEPSTSATEALHLRARAYIVQKLRDPALNVAQIAEALHCSKRYLHFVFANKGNTVDELIWKLRLEGCRNDLKNPALTGRSLTEIAFSWGFNSYPHFSRKFRNEFGASPRSVQAGAAKDA
ncbi:MAG TPA: helix-turn-helix domain-containing protein [Candidatus Acidoferrales bacterium]|nr:helix-turn-helix domain-containing protein [Candidatus Acidoferrales bacterium]